MCNTVYIDEDILITAAFFNALSQSPSLKSISLERIHRYGTLVREYINDNEDYNLSICWFNKNDMNLFLVEHNELFKMFQTNSGWRIKFKKPCDQSSLLHECKRFILCDAKVRTDFSKVSRHFRLADEESYT